MTEPGKNNNTERAEVVLMGFENIPVAGKDETLFAPGDLLSKTRSHQVSEVD